MVFSLMLFLMAAAIGFFQYIQGFFQRDIVGDPGVRGGSDRRWVSRATGPFLFNMKAYDFCQRVDFDHRDLRGDVHSPAAACSTGRFPGNVRFPVLVDKIGGGRDEAYLRHYFDGDRCDHPADAMPFGTTIFYLLRLEISDKKGTYVGRNGQQVDVDMYDVVMGDS